MATEQENGDSLCDCLFPVFYWFALQSSFDIFWVTYVSMYLPIYLYVSVYIYVHKHLHICATYTAVRTWYSINCNNWFVFNISSYSGVSQ